MDQSHCLCPYEGRLDASFNNPLKQHILGVKVHGLHTTLYRTLDTVPKSANLTIHTVLSELQKWHFKFSHYPETLYIQLDGGSENANKEVLTMLELLVAKRVCREIYFTRLPPGHSHEDIDAVFAIIWDCFKNQPCLSLQEYKELIERRLGESALRAKVEDIMVIPDYSAVLAPCLDKKLSRLHKEDYTQHQWRFQAVTSCYNFPLGVKTTFKAYSADRVVVISKRPKEVCESPIGQVTGKLCMCIGLYILSLHINCTQAWRRGPCRVHGCPQRGALAQMTSDRVWRVCTYYEAYPMSRRFHLWPSLRAPRR